MTGEKPDLEPCTWIGDGSEVKYLTGTTPQLVLHVLTGNWNSRIAQKTPDICFRNSKRWVKLTHQTGGYACDSVDMYAMFLTPTAKIAKLMQKLNKDYYESCICEHPSFADAKAYVKLLSRFGLTANYCYGKLSEGYYPVDIDCLESMTTTKLPKDLQRLVRVGSDKSALSKLLSYTDFRVAILTENCD